MQRVWFVTNLNSGAASDEKCEALTALFQDHDLELVGRTRFPDDALPERARLESAAIDTVILFAGDGTINATLCRLAKWPGSFLILPGGTMNLLAKALHDSLDPAEILHAARKAARRLALPYVEAGQHRAFVGLIIGPGASWVRVREALRAKRFVRLLQAVRIAWNRTFGRRVRISGLPRLRGGYQAVYITADLHGLRVAGVAARDWAAIVELGWTFLTGNWLDAHAVETGAAAKLSVEGRKPVMALFDGEPEMLDPETQIICGLSSRAFITTKQS
jgi:diacylglycerol kinase family enzyme